MIFFFAIFILTFIVNMKFKKLDGDYLNKNNTTIINGIFVVIVFFSHFISYNIGYDYFIIDKYFVKVIHKIGQLMVTSFLFYSGFGIFYKIKENRDKYINSFFKNRFLHLLFNFDIVICFYILVNIVFDFMPFSIVKTLLSFIGWESIGNSNWYIFVILILYLAIIFVFKIFKNKSNLFCLIVFSIISIIYIYVLNIYKELYWCNTILCFPCGMWYCYYKNKIDDFIIKRYFNYISIISILIVSFLALYFINENVYIYNIFSVIFILIISLILITVSSESKILLFLGKNVFWIYILQRIPMIILQGKLNIYLYFLCCFFITLVISYLLSNFSNYLWKKIHFLLGDNK